MSPIPDKPPAESKPTESTAPPKSAGSEDKVGYKNPPKAFQFVKGRSGNPKGRKKAKTVEDVGVILDEVLNESVPYREGQQARTITRLEATVQALRVKALKGDPKSMRSLLKLTETLGMFNKTHRQSSIIITDPDGDAGKILRVYRAEQDALQKTKTDS